MPSNRISNFARIPPPSVSPNSLDYRLQVHLQARAITTSKVPSIMVFQAHISKLARSRPPSVSPNSVDYALQVRTIMAFKCISTLARSRSRSASLGSLEHGLQEYLQIRSITTSECMPNSLDHSLGLYLWIHSIVIFRCTSNLLWSTAPAASPDILCRRVAI